MQPFPCGLLLLLARNMLMDFSYEFIIKVSFELLPTSFSSKLKGWLIPFSILCVLLTAVGWVGDSMLGRYRAIIAGFFFIYCCIFDLSAFVMLQFNWTQITAIIILCVSQLMAPFGLGSILTNMLPFTYDGSNDWSHNWWHRCCSAVECLDICYWITCTISCLPPYTSPIQNNLVFFGITLTFLDLSVVLITDCLFHTWLDNSFRSSNPLKLFSKCSTMPVKPSTQSIVVCWLTLMRKSHHDWTMGSTNLVDHSQKKKWRMLKQSCDCCLYFLVILVLLLLIIFSKL